MEGVLRRSQVDTLRHKWPELNTKLVTFVRKRKRHFAAKMDDYRRNKGLAALSQEADLLHVCTRYSKMTCNVQNYT